MKYIIHFDTGRSWRGGQNQVYLLIAGLKNYGIKQLLITPEGSPLEKKVKKLNIEVKNLNPVNDIDFVSGIKFRKIVKKKNPDIIHFHTSKSLGIGCWALRGVKVKTVFTRRVGLSVSKSKINLIKYKYPDLIVVISEYIRNHLNSLGFKNIIRIYSTVDLDRFQLKKNIEKNNRLNIGMVGAFDLRNKDFITFIKSAGYVLKKETGVELKFLIAGKGKDENKIMEFIKSLNITENVKIAGFIPDIEKFISSIDILVHTVNFEGLGTVVLQAMAVGVPVIATSVGGIPELIENGINGYLVEKNNPLDTSEKIIKLIKDVELRRRFSIKSRKIVESEFSKEKMIQEYMKLYENWNINAQ